MRNFFQRSGHAIANEINLFEPVHEISGAYLKGAVWSGTTVFISLLIEY